MGSWDPARILPRPAQELQETFLLLLHRSVSPGSALSAKEERTSRSALRKELAEKEIPCADRIAETMVMMGIHDDPDPFLPLLRHPNGGAYLEMAYKLSGLGRSAAIITTAADRAGKIVFALKSTRTLIGAAKASSRT